MSEHDPNCCAILPSGKRCGNASTFWVGRNGVDDYTYSCDAHLIETRKLFAPDGVAISMRVLCSKAN